MLLIHEVARLVGQSIRYTRRTRNFGLLVVLFVAFLLALASVTVTTLAPIAVYPFL